MTMAPYVIEEYTNVTAAGLLRVMGLFMLAALNIAAGIGTGTGWWSQPLYLSASLTCMSVLMVVSRFWGRPRYWYPREAWAVWSLVTALALRWPAFLFREGLAGIIAADVVETAMATGAFYLALVVYGLSRRR